MTEKRHDSDCDRAKAKDAAGSDNTHQDTACEVLANQTHLYHIVIAVKFPFGHLHNPCSAMSTSIIACLMTLEVHTVSHPNDPLSYHLRHTVNIALLCSRCAPDKIVPLPSWTC